MAHVGQEVATTAHLSREKALREALSNMLKLFGHPQPGEYLDGGASYRLALKVVETARAALTNASEKED
jgi:hypothetical protein